MSEKLKNYVDASGYKLKFISEQLGMTYPGLRNKLMGKTEFTVSEALHIKTILNISDEDFTEIFSAK